MQRCVTSPPDPESMDDTAPTLAESIGHAPRLPQGRAVPTGLSSRRTLRGTLRPAFREVGGYVAIEVVPYTEEWIPAVAAFNRRMAAAGMHWTWYATPVDRWLPTRGDARTWREHYLAVEDGTDVRGGYALKPHEWWIRGSTQLVTDWQGPITEGVYSRRYNTLGLRLLREMLRQYPLLYSWGHGGLEQPMLVMLEKLGWLIHRTPFCLRVLRPFRFLRRNAFLRDSPARRLALDLAAFSGAGSIGLRALHFAQLARNRRSEVARAAEFERFGSWADELWMRVRDRYTAVALRDSATMNHLLPHGGWPDARKLRITRGAETLGWAVVMDTAMEDDRRFGRLRVGSIVDALALPSDAEAVVGAAYRDLRARGVDIVISNQAHPAWVSGFAAHGFAILENRRAFAASPELQRVLSPFEETRLGLHLTNMDGHGPMRL